jgi:quinoprotein glucose dehydrogenase
MTKSFMLSTASTGELLWQTVLPTTAVATPATYMVGGKQYVVIAAGGRESPKAPGSVYLAFSLP